MSTQPAPTIRKFKITALLIDLAATREQRRDLLDVLSTDDEKSAALAPFVIALRMALGEPVRAPAELMEVAQDIITEIEVEPLPGR